LLTDDFFYSLFSHGRRGEQLREYWEEDCPDQEPGDYMGEEGIPEIIGWVRTV
jgi:hypothetical protein